MIELTLLPQHLQSEPGGLIRATVTLHSPNPAPTAYLLEIHGLEESWYTLSLADLTLSAEEDATAILTLHPPLEAAQGVHPFELLATCPEDPEASARVEAVLLVEEAAPATMVAPLVAPGGPVLLAGLSRRWVVVGAVAAALLLFAGVAYALKSQGHHTNASALPCATATADAGCTSTPTPTVAVAQVISGTITPMASPTGGDLAAQVGTPNPSSGVVPGTATTNPATGAVPGVVGTNPGTNAQPGTPTSHQNSPSSVLPGSADSPNHPGQAPQPATATATGSPTVTPEPTDSPTSPPTATAPATVTATTTATAAITRRPSITVTPSTTGTSPRSATAHSTGTSKPTFTPPPTTTSPPTNSPIPSSTASGTISPTPKASPTPAEIAVRYGYDVTPDRFILKWQTANAQSFTVDGQPEPLSGQQAYDLRTHTFVLTATSLDGTQSKIAVVAVYVINSCEVRVNSQPATVPSAACQVPSPTITVTTGPSSTAPPSSTTAPSGTPIPSNTPIPTATPVYFPTDTAIPTATNTPIPTATTVPSATPIPTNTFTPVPTATPIPSDTAQPTSTATAPFTQTPTLSTTPSRTPTAFPTATGPAPR